MKTEDMVVLSLAGTILAGFCANGHVSIWDYTGKAIDKQYVIASLHAALSLAAEMEALLKEVRK